MFALLLSLPALPMTLLGWIAVSQIRHSSGKLYGMWLAVFDGLFFPLFALDALLGWWIFLLVDGFARYQHPEGGAANLNGVLTLAIPLGLLVDALIIRWVWRAVNQPLGNSVPKASIPAPPPIPTASNKSGWGMAALILCFGTLPLAVFCGALLHTNWRIVLMAVFALEVAALVIGIVAWRSTPGKIATIFSALLLLAFVPAGLLVAAIMRRSEVAQQFEQRASTRDIAAVAFSQMWTSGQWQREIRQQLGTHNFRFRDISMRLEQTTLEAKFTFSGLEEMRGNGNEIWVPVVGSLTSRNAGNGSWEVKGADQLDDVRFTVTTPAGSGVTPPPLPAVADRPVTYGPIVNGLQAAAKLTTTSGTFTLGEPINVQFWVRNVTDKTIPLTAGEWRHDSITITDENGVTYQQVPDMGKIGPGEKWIYWIWKYAPIPAQKRVLTAGLSVPFKGSELEFLPEDADLAKVTAPVNNFLKAKPGRYTVSYHLHFPDGNVRPESDGWVGELDTAPMTIEVKAPVVLGPTVDLVIPNIDKESASVLNFETGKLLRPPEEMVSALLKDASTYSPKILRWFRDNGGDAVVTPDGSVQLVEGVLFSPKVEGKATTWEELTPDLVATSTSGMTEEQRSAAINRPAFHLAILRSPAALIFTTRERSFGKLQILGSSENPPGLKVRYRLLQKTPEVEPMPNVTNAPSPASGGGLDPAKSSPASDSRSETISEKPKLRFLAWQDLNTDRIHWQGWHPDGTAVVAPDELKLMASSPPGPCGSSETNPTQKPRFLYLWFSHPAIDTDSFIQVKLFDPAGRPVVGAESMVMTGANSGWIHTALSPGTFEHTPVEITVRLDYSAEPWAVGREIAAGHNGGMSLSSKVIVGSIGQDADGKAFITINRSDYDAPQTQFDFLALTKDDRTLVQRGHGTSGFPNLTTETFTFPVPINEVKVFRLRTRPIRRVEFNHVSTGTLASPDRKSSSP